MEYLTTYGWVIIIIAIILLALFELGVFNLGGPNDCIAQSGYVCTNPVYTSNVVSFTLGQDTGKYFFNVKAFVASQDEALNNAGLPINFTSTYGAINIPGGVLAPGQTVTVNFPNLASGQIPKGAPVGYKFSGYIWISYCTTPGCTNTEYYVKLAKISAGNSGMSSFQTGGNTITTYPITINTAFNGGGNFIVYADGAESSPINSITMNVAAGTMVVLQPDPNQNSVFGGWGCTSTDTNACNYVKSQLSGPIAFYTPPAQMDIIVSFAKSVLSGQGNGISAYTFYNNNLYVAQDNYPYAGNIMAYSLSSGANTVVASNQGCASNMIIDSIGNVIWTNSCDNSVKECNANDCTKPSYLSTAYYGPQQLSLYDGNVLWDASGAEKIVECSAIESTCNNNPTVLAANMPSPGAITVNPSNGDIYWNAVLSGYEPVIMKCNAAGCGQNPAVFASWSQMNGNAVFYNNNLIWAGDTAGSVGIHECDIAIGCPSPSNVILLAASQNPQGLALYNNNLYWTGYSSGEVFSCNIGDCANTVNTIASDQNEPFGITVLGGNVYWENQNNGNSSINEYIP